MLKELETRFRDISGGVDFCSLRYLRERDELLTVRQDVPQPVQDSDDGGFMITVLHEGGMGYGAGSDLSAAGLKWAFDQALFWAGQTAGRCVTDFSKLSPPCPSDEYAGPEENPWVSTPLEEKFDLLRSLSAQLKSCGKIVDWEASLWHTSTQTLYLTSEGGRCRQTFSYMAPLLRATANAGSQTQTRTLHAGRGACMQGGMEILEKIGYSDAPRRIADEAVRLLSAPDCPAGTMDLVLAPDQMILQIHESIGHPLELDRILGDERNYAGTSFVTLDMFGSYQYGSELLNVTFDPTRPEQFASYAYDDEGLKAEKTYVIEKGLLKRPLGASVSQARANIAGVANGRACGWNRPPIDRMANLNVEPGESTFDEMIAAVENGVYMEANRSWSIDDSRNKFQFGCEYGRLIRDGQLGELVKNANYRGISATFWRSLRMVGNLSTFRLLGTPNCGKGEPNQVIRVGHAAPACLFTNVDVFGGA